MRGQARAPRRLTAPWSLRVATALLPVAAALGWCSPGAADPRIAAAGDIACSPSSQYYNGGLGTSTRCRQKYTSDLLVNTGLSAVLVLGDAQYDTGKLSSFRGSYDRSWGRLKQITRPAPGNHEYNTSGAAGYFDYFNMPGSFTGPAGDRDKGFYSFDVGAWHLIALNSSDHCVFVACVSGSPQERWLRADLAAHPASCTLAYWHHPRFNSGHDGNATFMQPLFKVLHAAGVDVVLGGHAHNYERFALQDPNGKLDRARGVRQFVVGTGGAFYTSVGTPKPNSQVRQANTYGVLLMTLHPTSYDWQFVSAASRRVTDSGTQSCTGLLPPAAGTPDDSSAAPESDPAGGAGRSDCDLRGTAGRDTIVGTPAGETICGLGGDDMIRAAGGDDLVLGGEGDDRLSGGAGGDRLYGEVGEDTLRGGDGRDVLRGGRGRDALYGGRGDDLLHGNFAADFLRGQSGDDRVSGEGGRNRLYGDAGRDLLIADLNRRGGDRVNGGRGRDVTRADPGDQVRSARRR
jgi:acid phosphatase type 7